MELCVRKGRQYQRAKTAQIISGTLPRELKTGRELPVRVHWGLGSCTNTPKGAQQLIHEIFWFGTVFCLLACYKTGGSGYFSMSHDQATAKSAEMPASVDVRELCKALMSVLETRQSSTDTLPLLKPGDNFDVWHSQANVHLASVAAKDRARYICRHLSTEALTKASAFGVKFDTDVDSLLSALRRVFATPKPPVDAYRQFSSRLQLPGESARDYLGCLRPLILAAFPDQPASLTDVVLAAHFRAGLLDDNLRRKLIKKANLSSEALLTLVQEYEERYGPSVATPCYSTSLARQRQTRSVATQTFRNFTRPFRGRQARVAQVSSESYPVPAVTLNSDFPAPIVNATVADRRVAFLVDTGAACSLLNPQGFTRTWLQQTEISHRHPCIVAANGVRNTELYSKFVRKQYTSLKKALEVARGYGAAEVARRQLASTHLFAVAEHCPSSRRTQRQSVGERQNSPANCPYCRRFGRRAQRCGHNPPIRPQFTSVLSRGARTPLTVPGTLNGRMVSFLLDTGASCSVICSNLRWVNYVPSPRLAQLSAANGSVLCPDGQACCSVNIDEFAVQFDVNNRSLGHTKVLQHCIDTGDARPIRQAPRRIPIYYQKDLEKMIQDMLNRNIIRPPSSPWASPIVLVKKKDGTLRLCADYRRLNAVTKRDPFPLPRIDDTIDALSGATWFCTLDLASGYWQVEVHPADRAKTAFVVPSGLYEFNMMPFGLANAPATFQRLITVVLRDITPTACLIYPDDIIVHGKTVEEHNAHLQEVLLRLKDAGLVLQTDKCKLLQNKTLFLGYILSPSGIHPDPDKISHICEWPTPKTSQEVRSFLGLASYYRKFVRGFAGIAAPPHWLTEKSRPFLWTKECEAAFDQLKRALTSPPILSLPDVSPSAGEFILDTDVSDRAIRAVLSQLTADVMRRANLYRTHELARTYLSTAHQRQKEYYDRHAHGAPYQPGDKVFWFQDVAPESADKFSTHWIGPFVVVEVPAEALCILRASDDPEGPTFAAHFNKLKPYPLDDSSGGSVSSELPSFPSAELPNPPTDPSLIVSVPSSPPAPAVPTPPFLPLLSFPPPLVSRTAKVPPKGGFGIPLDGIILLEKLPWTNINLRIFFPSPPVFRLVCAH
ncbi:hypothetical protein SprV_0200944200 [Sparganum proliferum]